MSWPCRKTHRCKGSIDAKVSIRSNAQHNKYCEADGIYAGWTLWSVDYDIDWDVHVSTRIATITYCPFCGMRLEDANEIT